VGGLHLSEKNLVIASRVHRVGAAFQSDERVLDQRHASCPRQEKVFGANAVLFRKKRGEIRVILGKNAHPKLSGVLERLQAADAIIEAHEDERWIQGQRRKGAYRQPIRFAVPAGSGDDRHTRSPITQNLAKEICGDHKRGHPNTKIVILCPTGTTMKRALLIAVVFLAGLTVAAQAPTTLRVDVRLVSVVATVTDASGKFVPGLSADDFTILDDGVPQKISHFTQDRDVPISVGILLDTSGSMAAKMRAATSAVTRFINNIHPEDDIFLMTFARDVSIEQDFTSDRRKLARALNSLNVSGGTHLYDALRQALDKVRTGRHDKRAILVISDGIDGGSKTTLEVLLRAIQSSEVLVYGLGPSQTVYADPTEHVPFTLPTPASSARGPAAIANARGAGARRGGPVVSVNGVNMSILNQFAANSGGQAFLLASTFIDTGNSEIDRVLTMIADELRGQYTLGYYPSKPDGPDAPDGPDSGRFHTIKVTTRGAHNVRARTGYQGRP